MASIAILWRFAPQQVSIPVIDQHASMRGQTHHLRPQGTGLPGLFGDAARAEEDVGDRAVAGALTPGVDASQGMFQTFAAQRRERRIGGAFDKAASQTIGGGDPNRPMLVERDENAEGVRAQVIASADEDGAAAQPLPRVSAFVDAPFNDVLREGVNVQPDIRNGRDQMDDGGRVGRVPENGRIGRFDIRIDREIATPRRSPPDRRLAGARSPRDNPRCVSDIPRRSRRGRGGRNGRRPDRRATPWASPVSMTRAINRHGAHRVEIRPGVEIDKTSERHRVIRRAHHLPCGCAYGRPRCRRSR